MLLSIISKFTRAKSKLQSKTQFPEFYINPEKKKKKQKLLIKLRMEPWTTRVDRWKRRCAIHVRRREKVPRCVRRGCRVSSTLCPYRTPLVGPVGPLLHLLLPFALSLFSSSSASPSAFPATRSAPSNFNLK